MTHLQPQISSVPCTCCRARSVRHVADRYPPLSKTTCRSQSVLLSGSLLNPSHPDLRCSHIMLVMVQAWSRAVQVASPSPISIETPTYCSIVRTESAITRTNPRPGVTVSNLSILTGYTTASVSGSGSGLSFHLETYVCSQFPWRNFSPSVCSANAPPNQGEAYGSPLHRCSYLVPPGCSLLWLVLESGQPVCLPQCPDSTDSVNFPSVHPLSWATGNPISLVVIHT